MPLAIHIDGEKLAILKNSSVGSGATCFHAVGATATSAKASFNTQEESEMLEGCQNLTNFQR